MKSIKVAKNWLMIVRSCPYCHKKNGVYQHGDGTFWAWHCYECGKSADLIIKATD